MYAPTRYQMLPKQRQSIDDIEDIGEFNDEHDQYPYCEKRPRTERQSFWSTSLLIYFLVTTNFLSFALLAKMAYTTRQLPSADLLGPASVPVEQVKIYYNSGLNSKRPKNNPFIGPSNNKTDEAWNSLLDVGLISLSEKEAMLLGAETAYEYNSTSSYVGVLEVFHQLHCLNRLRKRFYNRQLVAFYENAEIDALHTEHCWDYLRQSFMCLSDVNVGPVGWKEEGMRYIADKEGVKECRDFEKIRHWAKEHEAPMGPGNEKLLHHN